MKKIVREEKNNESELWFNWLTRKLIHMSLLTNLL